MSPSPNGRDSENGACRLFSATSGLFFSLPLLGCSLFSQYGGLFGPTCPHPRRGGGRVPAGSHRNPWPGWQRMVLHADWRDAPGHGAVQSRDHGVEPFPVTCGHFPAATGLARARLQAVDESSVPGPPRGLPGLAVRVPLPARWGNGRANWELCVEELEKAKR